MTNKPVFTEAWRRLLARLQLTSSQLCSEKVWENLIKRLFLFRPSDCVLSSQNSQSFYHSKAKIPSGVNLRKVCNADNFLLVDGTLIFNFVIHEAKFHLAGTFVIYIIQHTVGGSENVLLGLQKENII